MSEVRPFHCGTQYFDWTESNCARCKKQSIPPETFVGGFLTEPKYKCDLEKELCDSYIGEGTIPKEIADRMGHTKNKDNYGWMCSEVEWTEEWKKEKREIDAKLDTDK